MKHPAVIILGIVVLVLAASMGISYFSDSKTQIRVTDLPWMIELSDQQNPHVFGITLGESTLQDAASHWHAVPTIAYFKGGDESGSMEAFFSKVHLGPVQARIILELGASPEELKPFEQAAISPKPMPSGSYRYTLPEAQFKAAHQLTIQKLTFIPSASFDKAMIEQRFGKPAQLKKLSEDRSLWLYPEKRLGLILDEHGKEMLQYATNQGYSTMANALLELE